MSLNIGKDNSRFVVVKNPTMKLAVSDKIVFADLTTSSKTGRDKVDADGRVVIDGDSNPVPERKYSNWQGRFVGNAFEPAKDFGSYQVINVTAGWIERERRTDKSGKVYENYIVTISDFELLPSRDFRDAGEANDSFMEDEYLSGDYMEYD